MISDQQLQYAAAIAVLRDAHRVVITTHKNPDGDAVGSVCALRNALIERGIATRVILPTPAPSNLCWIAGAADMEVFDAERHTSVIASADTLVVLDVNALARFEPVATAMRESPARIVCIDHHVHPEAFAHVQCTDTDAPATCSMLHTIISELNGGLALSRTVAEPLYVGIMTDTGNFRFPRTTEATHRMIADLIEAGADPVRAYEEIFNRSTVQRLNMLGEALCSLRTFYDGQLCVMVVTHADLLRHACTSDDVEGFVQHTLAIAGVGMGIMIVELKDQIKLSFRSKGDTFVRDLAASFGGGGHVYAAGARVVDVPLDSVVAEVINRAESYVSTRSTSH